MYEVDYLKHSSSIKNDLLWYEKEISHNSTDKNCGLMPMELASKAENCEESEDMSLLSPIRPHLNTLISKNEEDE